MRQEGLRRRLSGIEVEKVDLVDSPAIERRFLLVKRNGLGEEAEILLDDAAEMFDQPPAVGQEAPEGERAMAENQEEQVETQPEAAPEAAPTAAPSEPAVTPEDALATQIAKQVSMALQQAASPVEIIGALEEAVDALMQKAVESETDVDVSIHQAIGGIEKAIFGLRQANPAVAEELKAQMPQFRHRMPYYQRYGYGYPPHYCYPRPMAGAPAKKAEEMAQSAPPTPPAQPAPPAAEPAPTPAPEAQSSASESPAVPPEQNPAIVEAVTKAIESRIARIEAKVCGEQAEPADGGEGSEVQKNKSFWDGTVIGTPGAYSR